MMCSDVYNAKTMSIRRLANTLAVPVSTVGRWVRPQPQDPQTVSVRPCPVSQDLLWQQRVKAFCDQPRHRTYGYRRITALLRRQGFRINRKTVWRIMHQMGLSRPKIRYKSVRPKHVEKMRPFAPNQGWQIDMTSFALSDLTAVYLMLVTDCYSRRIVGFNLDRRCTAGEWIGALRMALDQEGLTDKQACEDLTVRSDNGAQPCSKRFVEFLGQRGVKGQYTGYNAPDDNAYVERVIRTVKEEEIWCNSYDTLFEARKAIEEYVQYYNQERIHSALDYRTPNEVAAAFNALAVA